MAIAVYYLFERHFPQIRSGFFSKSKIEGVNFKAEFLTKKTKEDKEYADVIKTMSDLELDPTYLKKNKFLDTSYILIRIDLERNNVP